MYADLLQMSQGSELHFTKPDQGTQPLALVFRGIVSMQNGSPAKLTPTKRKHAADSTLASSRDSAVAGADSTSLTPSSKRPAGILHNCTVLLAGGANCPDKIRMLQVHFPGNCSISAVFTCLSALHAMPCGMLRALRTHSMRFSRSSDHKKQGTHVLKV